MEAPEELRALGWRDAHCTETGNSMPSDSIPVSQCWPLLLWKELSGVLPHAFSHCENHEGATKRAELGAGVPRMVRTFPVSMDCGYEMLRVQGGAEHAVDCSLV